jgi:hypothetical protein
MMYCCSGCRELVSVGERWKDAPGKIFCESCYVKARMMMADMESDLTDALVLATKLSEQVDELSLDFMIGEQVSELVTKLGEICEKAQPATTLIGKEEKNA